MIDGLSLVYKREIWINGTTFGALTHIFLNWLIKLYLDSNTLQILSLGCGRARVEVIIIFFLWSLLLDRLNIRNIMMRKNHHLECYYCVLCSGQIEESSVPNTFFLFFFFLRMVLAFHKSGLGHWDFCLEVVDRVDVAYEASNNPIFKELVIVTCWSIWKHRNGIIFYNQRTSTLTIWKRV